ncbi:MAG: hypothetical protein WB245_08070 [Acidimicrobiia bacterium]
MSQYDPNVNLATACLRIDARALEASNRRLCDVSRRSSAGSSTAAPVEIEAHGRSIETEANRREESLVGSAR